MRDRTRGTLTAALVDAHVQEILAQFDEQQPSEELVELVGSVPDVLVSQTGGIACNSDISICNGNRIYIQIRLRRTVIDRRKHQHQF